MSINGVTTGYYPTGYANAKAAKNSADNSFADAISEKEAARQTLYDLEHPLEPIS